MPDPDPCACGAPLTEKAPGVRICALHCDAPVICPRQCRNCRDYEQAIADHYSG